MAGMTGTPHTNPQAHALNTACGIIAGAWAGTLLLVLVLLLG